MTAATPWALSLAFPLLVYLATRYRYSFAERLSPDGQMYMRAAKGERPSPRTRSCAR